MGAYYADPVTGKLYTDPQGMMKTTLDEIRETEEETSGPAWMQTKSWWVYLLLSALLVIGVVYAVLLRRKK